MDKRKFFKKWNGKQLEDWGGVVSPEYRSFQRSLGLFMDSIAKEMGAEVTRKSNMHYDESYFVRKGENCVYVSHSNHLWNRTKIKLEDDAFLVRTAKSENDFHGGDNNYTDIWGLSNLIWKLLGESGVFENCGTKVA